MTFFQRILICYGIAIAATLVGLWRGRASAKSYMGIPLTAGVVSLFALLVTFLMSGLWSGVAPLQLRDAISAIVCTLVLAVLGYMTGQVMAEKLPDGDHKRGTVLSDGADAQRVANRDWRTGSRDLPFAGLRVDPADETKHFKLIGTTGTGKSTTIRMLLAAALERGDRAVIADPEGGYLARFFDASRGDVILNPFDARSRKWDVFGEVRESYDIEQLARSLIPDKGGSGDEWRNYARTFFAAVMKQSHALGERDIGTLYQRLTAASEEELRIILEGTPAQPYLNAGNARMFGSIRSVTATAVSSFAYIEEQSSPALSVRQWVSSGRGVLFITYRADQIAALKDLVATWMRLAIFETMSGGEGDRRLWFVVDELDALGRIDGLKDALARLRKFGGRCILGFQSIGQVSSTYGQGEAQPSWRTAATPPFIDVPRVKVEAPRSLPLGSLVTVRSFGTIPRSDIQRRACSPRTRARTRLSPSQSSARSSLRSWHLKSSNLRMESVSSNSLHRRAG